MVSESFLIWLDWFFWSIHNHHKSCTWNFCFRWFLYIYFKFRSFEAISLIFQTNFRTIKGNKVVCEPFLIKLDIIFYPYIIIIKVVLTIFCFRCLIYFYFIFQLLKFITFIVCKQLELSQETETYVNYFLF